jgi:NADH dehydrogenase (ubiquinone) 1 alpha subcomplex subunit 9
MAAVPMTLSLPGPSTLSYAYLLELISTLTCNAPSTAPTLPKALMLLVSKLAQKGIFWPTLSPDEIERRYIDDVGAGQDAKFRGDWHVVGVEPDEIEKHAITYVRRYRSACVIFCAFSRMSAESKTVLTTRGQSFSLPGL